MIELVTHGARVSTQAVVARTLRCEHCGVRFVYLDRHPVTVARTGSIAMSADWLHDDAHRQLRAELKRFAEGPARSEAACPDCGRYQPDMVRRSRRRVVSRALLLAVVAPLLMGFLAAVVALAVRVPFTVVMAPAALSAVAVLIVGTLVCLATCLRSGSRCAKDPWAMDYDAFVERCRDHLSRAGDPVLAWYARAAGERDGVVSLGIAGDLPPGLEALSPARMVRRQRVRQQRYRR